MTGFCMKHNTGLKWAKTGTNLVVDDWISDFCFKGYNMDLKMRKNNKRLQNI